MTEKKCNGMIKETLSNMLFQDRCTCCGKIQEVGEPFYPNEPNQYLCEECNNKPRCQACNNPVLNTKKVRCVCGRKWRKE